MQWRLVCCMLLVLWRGITSFQLHDILRDLQTENAFLHSKVENMTEMLLELKYYIWNSSRGPEPLQDSTFCKQDIAWSDSSLVNCPVPLVLVASQALLSLLNSLI